LSIWLSVDPMSDKYPSMSPYNYCANNPIIFLDPDGKEKILSLLLNDPGRKAAESFPENGPVIHIFAHGNNQAIYIIDPKTQLQHIITTPEQFKLFLELNSTVWKENHANGKDLFTIIVLHSCHTAFENGVIPSIASRISNYLPNTLIVAPTAGVKYNGPMWIGSGDLYDTESGFIKINPKAWIIYQGGNKVNSFYGLTKPLFDNPQKMEIKYIKKTEETSNTIQ